MPRSCSPGFHSPSPTVVRNQGFEFSHCRHCGQDLIRSNRRWRTVPRGFRIVWRSADGPLTDDPAQLQLDLSASGRALVVRGPDLGPIWRLGSVLGLAATGFFYLVWVGADQLRDSWKRLTSRQPRHRVMRLPAA